MLHGRTVTVELRAVNHRYLDCTVKAPRQFGFLDDAVKKAAAARIARGKTEIYVSVETDEGGDLSVTVNHVARRALSWRRCASCLKKYGLRDDVTVMSLAKLPDVLGSERIEQDADELTQDVLTVFAEACDGFDQMREREGEKLAEDVQKPRLGSSRRWSARSRSARPKRVAEYREKLLARMREVLESTDDRRDAHRAPRPRSTRTRRRWTRRPCACAAICSSSSGMAERRYSPIGRKLDFLVQEMNREANTIGSKANDVEMAQDRRRTSRAEIEKIREQIQNIE